MDSCTVRYVSALPWGKIGLLLFIALAAAAMATQAPLLGLAAMAALGLIALD